MKKLFLTLVVALGMASTSMASPTVSASSPDVQEINNVQKREHMKIIVKYNKRTGQILEIIVIKY